MRTTEHPPRPIEATTLAGACAVAGLACLLLAAAPFSPTASRSLAVVLGVLGLGLGLLLWRRSTRVAPRTLHVVVAACTALISLCVGLSTTAAGAALSVLAYVWVAVYSATFHSRRAVAGHLAFLGVGLGVGLAAAGAQAPVHTWAFAMATIGGVAWILNGKVLELRENARLDALTGALSRAAFLGAARAQIARSARTGEPVTLGLLDLDDFKAVNDTRGHAGGDAVLVALARGWLEGLRASDVLGRTGGDEFAVLLPGVELDGARVVVDRLREAGSPCAWSAGLATWRGPEESLEEWCLRADQELYAEKAARRGRSGTTPVPPRPA